MSKYSIRTAKCVICRKNLARPNSYITCEELSCYKGYLKFRWQHRTYGKNAKQLLAELNKEVKRLHALEKKRDAVKRYLNTVGVFKMTNRTVDN